MRNQFGDLPGHLQNYIESTYYDGVHRQYNAGKNQFPPMNTSQVMCVCQCLLRNADFGNYSILLQPMSVVIGPACTGKKNTLIHLFRAFYASSAQHSTNMVSLEILRRFLMDNKSCHNQNRLFQGAGRLRTQKILIVAPTNNAINVINSSNFNAY